MKGRRTIVPAMLPSKVLKQLHINHIGIEKIRLLAWKSIYRMNMNANIDYIIFKLPHIP